MGADAARMAYRTRSRAVLALLMVVATVGFAACGGSSANTTVARSCLDKNGARAVTLAARIACQDAAKRDCPKGNTLAAVACDTGVALRPDVELRLLKTRFTFLPAWVACIAKHGYKLRTPSTSGNGPVFPAGTERISAYRTAAEHCQSIERQAIHALNVAGRS